jgi:threonine dehydrogenase-like Zn-dependent dehydrogenase
LQLAGMTEIYAIDPIAARRNAVIAPAARAVDPGAGDAALVIKRASGGVDVAIDASGVYAGLNTAVRCVKVGGQVITVSTYTGRGEPLNLGEEYHRNRIELISSMSVNNCPHRSYPLWDIPRLLATTRLLLDRSLVTPERLVSDVVPFTDLPSLYDELLASGTERLGILISYEGAAQ